MTIYLVFKININYLDVWKIFWHTVCLITRQVPCTIYPQIIADDKCCENIIGVTCNYHELCDNKYDMATL